MDDLARGRVPDRVEPHIFIFVTHVGSFLQVEGQPQQLLGDAQPPARDHLHGEGFIEQVLVHVVARLLPLVHVVAQVLDVDGPVKVQAPPLALSLL